LKISKCYPLDVSFCMCAFFVGFEKLNIVVG